MRYHKIDGWRGYAIPDTAVVGCSYTGEYSDSPCPMSLVNRELLIFRKEVLRPARIKAKRRYGQTSNVFCAKVWLCVPRSQYESVVKLVKTWWESNKDRFLLLHLAD